MKLLIHGRNLDVTPALRDYTETKLDRAIHHFDDLVQEADVHLSVARNPRVPQQTAEVTVFANGTVIRAQERSENLYASIDLVASKLARQLRRFKDRNSDHHHSHGQRAAETLTTEAVLDDSLPLGAGKLTQLVCESCRGTTARRYFDGVAEDCRRHAEEADEEYDARDHAKTDGATQRPTTRPI